MIINVNKLTDFKSGHSRQAEVAVMNALCYFFDLEPGHVTSGNAPDYDFAIGNTTIELKISSKGTYGVIELSKADGRPGGLSATKADLHAFLNPAGCGIGKLRLVRTYELKRYFSIDRNDLIETKTQGDKIGSILAPLDLRNFEDLFVLECDVQSSERGLEFDTSTFRINDYGKNNIGKYIT
jgi:hypothetical protein